MVVDDNPVCRKQTEIIAGKLSECVAVGSGDEAIAAFIDTFRKQEKKFTVILLDFEMPEVSGIDVILEIRRAEVKRNVHKDNQVKIIMLTSHNDKDVIMACKAAGCNHYILKPVTLLKLQTKLKLLDC